MLFAWVEGGAAGVCVGWMSVLCWVFIYLGSIEVSLKIVIKKK